MGMLVGFEDARKAYVDTHPCVDSAFRFKFCYISISLVIARSQRSKGKTDVSQYLDGSETRLFENFVVA